MCKHNDLEHEHTLDNKDLEWSTMHIAYSLFKIYLYNYGMLKHVWLRYYHYNKKLQNILLKDTIIWNDFT